MDNLCVIGHRKITISQLIRQCRSAVNLHVCTYIVRTTPVVYSGSTEQNMLLRNWFGTGLTGIMETIKWYNERQPDLKNGIFLLLFKILIVFVPMFLKISLFNLIWNTCM